MKDAETRWIRQAFGGNEPLPWQARLLARFKAGDFPSSLDIPTGLGKTAVMSVWLVARALGAPVARRLVYVVDRRAVVDQATGVALVLRQLVGEDPTLKQALGLESGAELPISTLRGQFADNREWLTDPSSPAIVIGTVDMIGSRLLFEGYGVSRRMRPYHAGLLGADTLLVLDEAHLVPPFERLLRQIAEDVKRTSPRFAPEAPELRDVVPKFRLLSLSATGRDDAAALRLDDADRAHPVVKQRLAASKKLEVRADAEPKELAARIAKEAWALAKNGKVAVRCIVFCDRRKDAQAVYDLLAKQTSSDQVELFTGGRRVWERKRAAEWLTQHGFIAGEKVVASKPTFVVATSAGEVGVDLDADHMISDLVAWERMVQRLGRVNRRGDGAASVVVIPRALDEKTDEAEKALLGAARALLDELPRHASRGQDASPAALVGLKTRARKEGQLRVLLANATTPEALFPELTRPVLEAWSMTSLDVHTGRPEIAPWLRGWVEDDEPQTTLVFREYLPLNADGDLLNGKELEVYLDTTSPHLLEQLEVPSWQAMEWLTERLEMQDRGGEPAETKALLRRLRQTEVAAVLLQNGAVSGVRAVDVRNKKQRDRMVGKFAGATLLVDIRVGGLVGGMLATNEEADDVALDVSGQPNSGVPFRMRRLTADDAAAPVAARRSWREEARIPLGHSPEGNENAWLVIESDAREPAESEEGRSVTPGRAQLLDEHEEWTEREARRLAQRIQLPEKYAEMLALAARLHDEGKRARQWQLAFGAPADGKTFYGKTLSRPNQSVLAGYRHELGSLPYAESDARVARLEPELRDLCLHLIVAHHGHARPLIPAQGADEPPSRLQRRARQIALRFSRLEKRWGPWGLAWWESLLRAADQRASRRNDEEGLHG